MKEQYNQILAVIDSAEDQSEFLLVVESLISIAKSIGFDRSYTQSQALESMYRTIKYADSMKIETARRITKMLQYWFLPHVALSNPS